MSKRNNLNIFKYFGLTFLISWSLWSPFYFSNEVSEFWVLPGAWGPTIAALILTYYDYGKKGIRELLRKLLIWKVPVKYYIFSIFGIFFLGLIAVLFHKTFVGRFPDAEIILKGMGLSEGQVGLAILLSPIFFLVNTLFGGPIAEELGWRGYAQGMMQKNFSPNLSGLIIGFLWSIWHLPLILFFPKAIGSIPILIYIPLMTAMGVIFSWLYNRTKGSVLLAVLLHGGMNFTLGFLGADVLSNKDLLMTQVGLIMVVAIILSQTNKKEEPNQPVANNSHM
ncbi:CPBP family intramembrane glutamic endopeptidase [Cyclobacterium jeungdonense]|uniref:Type II CAAX endopeptidase family protein n=1 Tax=Cyclobacterium jeungdonense TaxID=708087 RepID=A0ABT8C760_9BACT|nr:type II CAAX endopeptidase family protein [Cyclobacterium jeungdonense]MDN3688346.1 type II CAAX endopeptidase family protein [Cyclobacterium jeungdonense]